MSDVVSFISDAGGSVVSKNILSHKGKLRWCVREESVNDVDNANIEPAILTIYNCKVGTDLELVDENGKKYFLDNSTGKKFKV